MFEKSINVQHDSDCCHLDHICDKNLIQVLNSVKVGQYQSFLVAVGRIPVGCP